MTLRWLGHSCFEMRFSNLTVVTDPFDDHVGYPLPTVRADVATVSHGHGDHNHVQALPGAPIALLAPGNARVRGAVFTGIPSHHDGEGGSRRGDNLMFVVEADGLRVAHLGDLGHLPTEAQYAALGALDLLLLPIGGYYTIDAAQAAQIVARLKPRVVVPMHYKTDWINFPIADEKPFLTLAGGEYAPANRLTLSPAAPGGPTRVVVLPYEPAETA